MYKQTMQFSNTWNRNVYWKSSTHTQHTHGQTKHSLGLCLAVDSDPNTVFDAKLKIYVQQNGNLLLCISIK